MMRLILIPHGISVLMFWIPSAPPLAVQGAMVGGQRYGVWSAAFRIKPPPQCAFELKGTVQGPVDPSNVPEGYPLLVQ
jgi:hypothetical protein